MAGYGEMLFFCDFFVVSLIVIDFVLLDFALNYSYSMVLVWNNLHVKKSSNRSFFKLKWFCG